MNLPVEYLLAVVTGFLTLILLVLIRVVVGWANKLFENGNAKGNKDEDTPGQLVTMLGQVIADESKRNRESLRKILERNSPSGGKGEEVDQDPLLLEWQQQTGGK